MKIILLRDRQLATKLDYDKITTKTLLCKIFIYKPPLIVIVAPQKYCLVKGNRVYGLWNSKYVVIFDPLLAGHLTRSLRSELFGL